MATTWKPDPTFYPSPASAAAGPPEEHAYVATLNTGTPGDVWPDALTVVDLRQGSSTHGTVVGRLDMPNVGDELHHRTPPRTRGDVVRVTDSRTAAVTIGPRYPERGERRDVIAG